ncbi:TKL/TKL-ccin protein kinase [Mycena sanguinolenta]|uniref:TKL/TKL-ccin protein kinase n=1 Tax=Mycena sanguinolenta TaxID=230812 RepID=A0A8H7DC10_9AGAR|nr:TKL/TKL-ccin protein kinase [Mycena sanguinolenta]
MLLSLTAAYLRSEDTAAAPLLYLVDALATIDSYVDTNSCRVFKFSVMLGFLATIVAYLATIFACTWVLAHLNAPLPGPSRFQLFWRRLIMTLIGIIVPELTGRFAARKCLPSRRLSIEFKFSSTQGFFLCTGGFVSSTGYPVATTVLSSKFQEAIRNVVERDLGHRSKSIACGQVVDTEDGEEVCFGHPCIAESISSQSLKGRVFRTDQFPFATGGNSNIYRGQLIHKTGKVQIAIKFIRVSNDRSGQFQLLQRLKRETRVWSALNHRNLLPFLGVWDEPVAPYPALIAPFYKSGDLGQYLRKCSTLDKEKMILGVAAGLEYLHRHEIVHGDLKVHNVLIDKHGAPCICDFGISKIMNLQGFTTASTGTTPYMAPELFVVLSDMSSETFDRSSMTTSSDIYSFGLLVLEIVTTKPPKHRPNRPILTATAHNNLRPRRSDYDSDVVSSELWDVLDACWEPDPSLRPAIGDIILRMPLDTSDIRIATQFAKIPALLHAAESLCAIIRDCQKLSQNRHAARQLANRCHRLLLELLELYTDSESMQSTIDEVTRCLMSIQTNISLKQMDSRMLSIQKQEEVGDTIAGCHFALEICSKQFQLIPHLGVYEDAHYYSNNRKDHDQVLDYLAAIQEISMADRTNTRPLMS